MRCSVVEYFGLGEGHRCGYCGNSDTNVSHGMWAHFMTCGDYEDLMNRGWRRSGKYVYKPLMNVTCCPMYTIRCDVAEIKLSKSQKKVLKRMNRFLISGTVKSTASELQGNVGTPVANANDEKERHEICEAKGKAENSDDKCIGNAIKPKVTGDAKCKGVYEQKNKDELPPTGQTTKSMHKSDAKVLEDFISELDCKPEVKHKLEVKLCKVYPIDDHQDLNLEESFSLFCKYQKAVHKDPIEKLNLRRFKRFLVNSPLIAEDAESGLPSTGLGSFHQQYFIDGQLIAVGVIDILPHCVSSKYFFYDPEYSFLSLGTYSALREIYFVRRLQEECANMKYYYMGYYIHSCHKMRYKGSYDPSFLLCPETYKFQPIKICLEKLNSSKYSRLAPENEDPDAESNADVNNAIVLHQNQPMPFQIYAEVILSNENSKRNESTEVQEYCQLVGAASERMLLFRQ